MKRRHQLGFLAQQADLSELDLDHRSGRRVQAKRAARAPLDPQEGSRGGGGARPMNWGPGDFFVCKLKHKFRQKIPFTIHIRFPPIFFSIPLIPI